MYNSQNTSSEYLSPRDRISICKQCPMYDSIFGRCKDCGCFLRAKVQLEGEECPQGKW